MHLNRTAINGVRKTLPLRGLSGLSGLSGEHVKTLIRNIPPKLPNTALARHLNLCVAKFR